VGRRDVTGAGGVDADGATDPGRDHPEPADGADPSRCGCAGKTPLSRVVLPARERVAAALAGTAVDLGDDVDAAVTRDDDLRRETDVVALGADASPAFAGGEFDPGARGEPAVVLACAFLGDELATPDRLGSALAAAYRGLDGSPTLIGKGHAVQVPDATGGWLWLERVTPSGAEDGGDRDDGGSDRDGDGGDYDNTHKNGRDGVAALNVDAVHAFPALSPSEQARIASLNALNDVHAVGATDDRLVRPVVATPADRRPDPARVAEWYAAGTPADVSTLAPSLVSHGGDGWLLGASVTARGRGASDRSPLPDDCGVLVTRPPGGLACFAHGVAVGDDDRRERGSAHLRRDTRPVAGALAAFRPGPDGAFDPARHVARVTDVSGEGIAGLGRIAAADGRALCVERIPLLPGAAAAARAWTVPDVTVETNGPLAVFARPGVLSDVADRLAGVDGADPRRLGSLRGPADAADAGAAPSVVDATGAGLSEAIEAAARWPSVGRAGGTVGDERGGEHR